MLGVMYLLFHVPPRFSSFTFCLSPVVCCLFFVVFLSVCIYLSICRCFMDSLSLFSPIEPLNLVATGRTGRVSAVCILGNGVKVDMGSLAIYILRNAVRHLYKIFLYEHNKSRNKQDKKCLHLKSLNSAHDPEPDDSKRWICIQCDGLGYLQCQSNNCQQTFLLQLRLQKGGSASKTLT